MRYEYTRHSEAAKRALGTAELEDQTPADREMLNALETNQGAWVWALRSLYPHLRHDRPFLVVPSADIASSLKMMGASAGFGRTKPHPLPALLSQIAPRPGHAISDRQVLMKWDRLHGKRRKPKAPEQREGTATKTRRLSDDEADRHIPGRQFAEDGSELWLFTLQLEASTVEEIAAGMADHITQFAPSERPRINAAARAERKGNAIELLPLPPCIPEIDNGAGGYRSLVRIRWQEFSLKEVKEMLPQIVGKIRKHRQLESRNRSRAFGQRGMRDLDRVTSAADALIAWRLRVSSPKTWADRYLKVSSIGYDLQRVTDDVRRNCWKKPLEAQRQFAEFFSGETLLL